MSGRQKADRTQALGQLMIHIKAYKILKGVIIIKNVFPIFRLLIN
jgi:hypothetical protein